MDTKEQTPKQERDEAAEARKVLVRKASADVLNVVLTMLNQSLTWTEITAVLDAAASSARQQMEVEK